MEITKYLEELDIPGDNSHKGQNGKLLIIGGSHLFHSASLWSLKTASRIVDLVHYSSVDENNKIVQRLNEEFRDGIVIFRENVEDYAEEDDCILIGPGMVRTEALTSEDKKKNPDPKEITKINDEGMQTYFLTKYLLKKYPQKKWVIDAGALQMLEPEWIPTNAILTPHHKEFEGLFNKISSKVKNINAIEDKVQAAAKYLNCIIVHKGKEDFVADKNNFMKISGGNAGMTKGGTGDVLAGLISAFYTTNEAFTSAVCGSYINKSAGDDLYQKSGLWFNATDLTDQIPQTMKRLLLS